MDDEEWLQMRLDLQRQIQTRCRERMIDFTPVVISGRGEVATVQMPWDTFVRILGDAGVLS